MFELLDDRYRLGDRISRSSAEESREAWDQTLNRTVTVKLLPGGSADGRERFKEAARTATAVSAPHLVPVSGYGECELQDAPIRYLAAANVKGRPLSEASADGPLPLTTLLAWGEQLCEALAAAHLAGLVHGDITPDNVIVTKDGTVTLLAPSIARLSGQTGAVGAWECASPELAAGSKDTGPASDLYALGCLLYILVTGRPPFTGTREEVLRQHQETAPEPSWRHAPLVPQRLDHLIRELLEKDPRRRPDDIHAVARRLREIADGPLPRFARPQTSGVPGAPPDATAPVGVKVTPPPLAALLIGGTVVGTALGVLREFTSLSTLSVAMLAVLAVPLVILVGKAAIALQLGEDKGIKVIGCGMLLAFGAAAVVAATQLPQPWWIAVPIGLAIGTGAGLAIVFVYALLVGSPDGVFQRYGYPLAVRQWAASAAAVIGMGTCAAAGLGYESWGRAVLWGLGAWSASSLVLGVLLVGFRSRR